jgi:predicted ATPase
MTILPEQPYHVMFGSRDALSVPSTPHSVLIVPTSEKWNDFGRRTRVDYRIRSRKSEEAFTTSGFIGFLGETSGLERLNDLVRNLGTQTITATSEHPFFTMLPSMEAYRSIVRDLDLTEAVNALTAARDIVATAELKPSTDWLEKAIQTSDFYISFVRNSEAYFAYKNAGPILRGLEAEVINRMSSTFTIQFQLAGYDGMHDLRFRFDHSGELPKRIAIIIGKNGIGKSQTLGRIAKAALDGDPVLTDGTPGGRPIMSRLLAFAPTNEAESVFSAPRRRAVHLWYQRYSLNRSRKAKRNDYLAELIVQLARSEQTIRDQTRFQLFLRSLSALSHPNQLALQSSNPDIPYPPINQLQRGAERELLERFASIEIRLEPGRVIEGDIYPLSSGEISFVRFAAQVSLNIENGSLVLIDEPETHLHPNFISRFVALLDGLLAATGSSAIISTHSAYFVREVFREQVTILQIDVDGALQTGHPSLQTFGADVGAISYFVFGEDEPSYLAAEVRERLRATGLSWSAIYERYSHELSLEFLNSLRNAIESGTEAPNGGFLE